MAWLVIAGGGCARGPVAPSSAPGLATTKDAEAPPQLRLPSDVTPLDYELELTVDPRNPRFDGRVSIEVQLARPRESVFLHARGLVVRQARALLPGGQAYEARFETLPNEGLAALRFRAPLPAGRVHLELSFEAPFGAGLKGLYRVAVADRHYAFTQLEPIAAREMFPCFDEPRFKTPFRIKVRVPHGAVAVSNAPERERRAVDAATDEVAFAPTLALPTYLVALAVGPFDVAHAAAAPANEVRKHPVPLRALAVHGQGAALAHALEQTPRVLASLERYTNTPYPYEKLDLVAVPDFSAGAMENAGLITYRDTYLLVRPDATEQQKRLFAHVHAHELAHQWFGNLVTMPWWDDVWLNESFASWLGDRTVAELFPEYEVELGEVRSASYAMAADSRKNARQIRQPILSSHDIDNAFDAITYSKGAAVLSMFERYVGEERFRDGLRAYLARHAFGNATATDLIAQLSRVAGVDLSAPFFSFLEQPGVPLIAAEPSCEPQKPATLRLHQARSLPLGVSVDPEPTWQIPLCVRWSAQGKRSEACTLLRERQGELALGPRCPDWIEPNADARAYARWSLPPQWLDRLVTRALPALSARERVSLVSNLNAALRSGAMPADGVLRALFALGHTKQRQELEAVLGTLDDIRDTLLEASALPAYRARVRALVAPLFRELGIEAKPGAEESAERGLLRLLVVRTLANTVEDRAVREALAKLGREALGLNGEALPAPLPRDLEELAVAQTIQLGDDRVFDSVFARFLASQDGNERARLLAALSSTRQPALATRLFELAFDPRVRVNESLVPLVRQLGAAETREHAFRWLMQNLSRFDDKADGGRSSALLRALGSFCSEERAKEIEAAFAPRTHDLPGGPRELLLTAERIRSCSAIRAVQADSAQAFFATRASGRTVR